MEDPMANITRAAISLTHDLVITDDGKVFIQDRGSPWVVRAFDLDAEEDEGDDGPVLPFWPCRQQYSTAC